ncbi:acetone carboxylase subunit gamma [Conexibacter sp. SYSU D00693]|uniref:acetone carboxylase subunit gamma n=1 Tax=Conexibacter sp. SYSU D00693 TaxID=2812560 RepID=UPI00196AFD16|nr:acetone carboxylase subunit gamma [Conexibacter sp. SYSU D00693]
MPTYTREPITEYLEVDLETETWRCRRCDHEIGPARESYKRGLLLHDRDPREVYPAKIDAEYSYAPDPEWCRLVECCCPGCGTQVEVEYLPPGHPITHDVELDVDALKERQLRLRARDAAATGEEA